METMDFGRSIAALLLVLALIGGLALLAKRWLPQLQASGGLKSRRLKMIESMALDPRNRLALVELDGQQLLIGLGQNGPVLLQAATQSAPSTQTPIDIAAETGAPS